MCSRYDHLQLVAEGPENGGAPADFRLAGADGRQSADKGFALCGNGVTLPSTRLDKAQTNEATG